MKKIKAGETIVCPKCTMMIAQFTTDVEAGTILDTKMVKSFVGPLLNGMLMSCPRCKTPFYNPITEEIFLSKRGWY